MQNKVAEASALSGSHWQLWRSCSGQWSCDCISFYKRDKQPWISASSSTAKAPM